MTQEGLINNIIKTCGIYGCNTSTTYKSVEYSLGTDAMKKPTKYQYQWKYSSRFIIMIYVTNNSCQNIECSVHQCAKSNHNPKHTNEKEVLIIYKYHQCNIKDGKSKELVIHHSRKMTVHCYI